MADGRLDRPALASISARRCNRPHGDAGNIGTKFPSTEMADGDGASSAHSMLLNLPRKTLKADETVRVHIERTGLR